ncbi:MAG TPA: ABC transporter ATP-binding protein [Bacteroidales bacterium]|nr:ABC transporter ATP-binding protein [Bacteroidales bacterium]
MNNSIEIKNASFVYKTKISKKETIEREVLHVRNLEIKQGEITFIIGRSGSGKSTLLETLGMMNDTFPVDTKEMEINFHLKKDEEPLNIFKKKIWEKKKDTEALLNQIRLNNFSFIFQNTNLLNNFTAIDNVCITDMLNGNSYSEAYLKSLIIFSLLGLGDLDVGIKPQHISGGQRQRVAFARAIIPDYQFLFGDEPTGNLDKETSTEVLQLLSDFIRGTNSETSTIIVSHDIDLALKFADRIIVITKEDMGDIKPENVFYRGEDHQKKSGPAKSYIFKSKIHKAFKDNPELIEGFKILVQDAVQQLEKESKSEFKIKPGFFQKMYSLFEAKEVRFSEIRNIKVNSLLRKILFLMQNPEQRSAGIRGLNFFDETFFNELESILEAKGTNLAAKNGEESEKAEAKSWRRKTDSGEKALGDGELRSMLSVLLKFFEREDKLAVSGSTKSIYKNENSFFFFLFISISRLLSRIITLKNDNLATPNADINNPDFARLFIRNEGGILLGAGKKLTHFRTLFFALFVTFLGIGFATGSLSYLKDKMDDPFVNFVTTSVPSEKQSEVASIIQHYNRESELKNQYKINVFTGFTIFPVEIYNKKNNDLSLITGRTITLNDPLLKELFKDKDNIITGNETGLFNDYDCGFIVSESLIKKLGMEPDARFLKVKILTTNTSAPDTASTGEIAFNEVTDNYELVPVPIRAILKKIPGDLNQDIDFIITEYAHLNLLDNHEPSKEYPFHPSHTSSLMIYYNTADSAKAALMKDTLRSIVKSHPGITQGFKNRNFNLVRFTEYIENVPFIVHSGYSENSDQQGELKAGNDSVTKSPTMTYAHPGFQIEFGFMGRKPDYERIQQMYDSVITILTGLNIDVSGLELLYKPNKRPPEMENTNPRLDRMMIHFNKLDKVEEFAKFLETTKYKYLRMDMAKIMSMKNYNYVANLTTGIIIFLIALSVYFISYFVASVIAGHLEKIKMNIGTLMAFGTSGLKFIYMNLISSYMLLSILVSFVAVFLAGSLWFCRAILWLIYFFRKGLKTDFSLEPGTYFEIFNEWTLTAVVLIFVLSSIMSWFKIKKVLKSTPGDLIFERE